MLMCRMYGNKIELHRYLITYTETVQEFDNDVGENVEKKINRKEFCISNEYKDKFISTLTGEYTVTEIDQTGNEWIDGMEFDSMELAQAALKMGESAYREMLYSKDTALQTAEYLVSLDYRLLLLEWGLI